MLLVDQWNDLPGEKLVPDQEVEVDQLTERDADLDRGLRRLLYVAADQVPGEEGRKFARAIWPLDVSCVPRPDEQDPQADVYLPDRRGAFLRLRDPRAAQAAEELLEVDKGDLRLVHHGDRLLKARPKRLVDQLLSQDAVHH